MTKTNLGEFKTLLPYLARYRFRYALGFLFLVAVDAAQVVIPQFMRRAVDIISSGAFELEDVIVPAAAMAALMAFISLGRFLWRFFINGSARRIETEMREKLFDHLLSLSYDFYQKNKIGDLMSRSSSDINAVRESIGMGLVALVDGTVMAAAILIIIFVQDFKTAAFAVLPLPLITVLILLFGGAVGKRFRRAQETYSGLSNVVQETFAGVRVLKSFVKEWWFIKKFDGANDDYRDANMELVKLFGFFFPFISFLSGLTVIMVLLAGGIRVAEGLMSPGDLVALFRYLQMLIWPIMGAGFVVNMIQRGAAALGRVNEVMNTRPGIRSPLKASRPDEGAEELVGIRNLSFAYPEGREALEDINLSIKRGTLVGILGPTGSGKSTLIKAMTRMIDPPPGTVFVKGIEAALWDLRELRKVFALTPQDSFLFSDSIRNNVLYGAGAAGAEGETLDKAVRLSALDRDLESFPLGLDTLIGERGLTLSGGQKQRTAVARSAASGREILILDDSLSAVDGETEKRILAGLREERRQRKLRGVPLTMIVISHRVSALSRADRIVVLEKGRISEEGTPRELLLKGGLYARTAALQKLGDPSAGEGSGG
ncbi:MAG: ABC transporter ATP-binding protein/permease [Treponema sp.]|jgi:ATP-binding cassette subfamily B protein|nr:ABC transporter ATP-binding protein/permease [Treponema sp.]